MYLGNLCGAMLILLLVMMSKMYDLNGSAWGLNALHVAQHKIHHDWSQAFALATLCNLLVCLGGWMTFSCKDALGKSHQNYLAIAPAQESPHLILESLERLTKLSATSISSPAAAQ